MWYAVGIAIVILFVAIVVKLRRENEASEKNISIHNDANVMGCVSRFEREDNDTLIGQIKSAEDEDELMEIVDDYELITEEAGDALLEKALTLNLSPMEWASIYKVADEGSELEKVAYRASRSVLEDA